MRLIGLLLIGSALLLGTGGVKMAATAETTAAGSATPASATEPKTGTSAEQETTAPAPAAQCSAPDAGPSKIVLELKAPRADEAFVPLNTRGYNYTRPGEIRPPAQPMPSAAPAAPEKPAAP